MRFLTDFTRFIRKKSPDLIQSSNYFPINTTVNANDFIQYSKIHGRHKNDTVVNFFSTISSMKPENKPTFVFSMPDSDTKFQTPKEYALLMKKCHLESGPNKYRSMTHKRSRAANLYTAQCDIDKLMALHSSCKDFGVKTLTTPYGSSSTYKYCADLVKSGKSDSCYTLNGQEIPFLPKTVYYKWFGLKKSGDTFYARIEVQEVQDLLKLDGLQFQRFCLLLGVRSDEDRINGYGPEKILKLVNMTSDDYKNVLKSKNVDPERIEVLRKEYDSIESSFVDKVQEHDVDKSMSVFEKCQKITGPDKVSKYENRGWNERAFNSWGKYIKTHKNYDKKASNVWKKKNTYPVKRFYEEKEKLKQNHESIKSYQNRYEFEFDEKSPKKKVQTFINIEKNHKYRT